MLPLGSSRFCRGIGDTAAIADSVDLGCEKALVGSLGDDLPGQFLEAFRRIVFVRSDMSGMKFSLLAELAIAVAAGPIVIVSLFALDNPRPVVLGANP